MEHYVTAFKSALFNGRFSMRIIRRKMRSVYHVETNGLFWDRVLQCIPVKEIRSIGYPIDFSRIYNGRVYTIIKERYSLLKITVN